MVDGAFDGAAVGSGVGDETYFMLVVVTTTLEALVMMLLETRTVATVDEITSVNEESYTAKLTLVMP